MKQTNESNQSTGDLLNPLDRQEDDQSSDFLDATQWPVLEDYEPRDVISNAIPPSSTSDVDLTEKNDRGFFVRCWQGKERLWKAFWLIGLVSFGASIAAIVGPELTKSSLTNVSQYLLLFILILLIKVYWWVSVWRCAENSSHWGWELAARTIVVLSAMSNFAPLINIWQRMPH